MRLEADVALRAAEPSRLLELVEAQAAERAGPVAAAAFPAADLREEFGERQVADVGAGLQPLGGGAPFAEMNRAPSGSSRSV
jgi:hypothetical protein